MFVLSVRCTRRNGQLFWCLYKNTCITIIIRWVLLVADLRRGGVSQSGHWAEECSQHQETGHCLLLYNVILVHTLTQETNTHLPGGPPLNHASFFRPMHFPQLISGFKIQVKEVLEWFTRQGWPFFPHFGAKGQMNPSSNTTLSVSSLCCLQTLDIALLYYWYSSYSADALVLVY